MDESIIVSSIVDKLPPSWKNTKRTLKHKQEDMSLEDLANHLRIKEELRILDDPEKHVSKFHVIKGGQPSKGPEIRKGRERTTTTRVTRRQK